MRTASSSHAWYEPMYNSPLFPTIQIFGIFSGVALLYFMGIEAVLGAGTAFIAGGLIYHSYGKKHTPNEITPWETFRLMLRNPDEAEEKRINAAFHAADIERNNHLNLNQFASAIEALQLNHDGHDAIREYFHFADGDGDGIIDIDEFCDFIGIISEAE